MCPRANLLVLCAALIGFAVVLGEREISGDIYAAGGRNLGYMSKSYGRHKCLKQVPSVLFRTEKDEQVLGNGTNMYFHEIIDCCEGYKRYKYDWNRCEPDCADKCENGFCRAPGRCECFDGFVSNDRGRCVFACPLGCENGVCYLNGTCRCNSGYKLDPSKNFCQPVCQVACGRNQMCEAPNKCGCKEGYQMTAIGCQPICTPDCGHGRCVAPNQCECFAGFAMRPPRRVCEADSPLVCENGFCDSRYQCVCHDGYKYDKNTTSCLPDCGDKCENGICREPGICECFVGYRSRSDTCVPICEHGCGYYGQCVAPGVCGCGQTGQLCNFGMCDSLGRCICNDGTMRFVHECVVPNRLETLVASFEQRQRYNLKLKEEFHNLIGKHFADLYSF